VEKRFQDPLKRKMLRDSQPFRNGLRGKRLKNDDDSG
jgi:hypothetical protein